MRTLAALHVAAGVAAAFATAVVLQRAFAVRVAFDQPSARELYVALVPLVSLAATLFAAGLGLATRDPARLARRDLATLALTGVAVALPFAGPLSRDAAGLALVLLVFARFAPSLLEVASGRVASLAAIALLSFAVYAPFAAWTTIASEAHGDQSHYLVATEALRRGTLDPTPVYRESDLFTRLTGHSLTDEDFETHRLVLAVGTRLAQGYALPALLLPGWIAAERLGALLVLAAVAALASALTFAFVREAAGDRPASSVAWLLTAFAAPLSIVAGIVYPNVVAALLLVASARWALASSPRRPVLAGLAGGLTLLLTPRDGLALALLAAGVLLVERRLAPRFGLGALVALAIAALVSLATFGTPLPYAGYLMGLAAFNETHDSAFMFRPDIALPGMLFDRAFGLAGSAPWVFVGALGAVPFWRARRGPAFALLLVIVGTLAVLAMYRFWQGGFAPPNRYLVGLLPLWAPFVAAGLAVAGTSPALRVAAGVLVALSLIATAIYLGIPTIAYSVFESHLVEFLRAYVPVVPYAWLPSFHVPPADSYGRSLVAALGVTILLLLGARRRAF